MSNSGNGLRHRHQQAMDSAANWFSRMRSPVKSTRLEEEFRAWLEEDPIHALAYEQCETIWTMTSELRNDEDIKQEIAKTREIANLNTGNQGNQGIQGSSVLSGLMTGFGKAAAVLLLMVGVLYMTKTVEPDKYYTDIGEQRLLVLPDDSTAILNTDTSLITQYNEQTRRIVLEKGEAYFDVKTDKDRPFEVHAIGGIVRAVGTAFNVAIQKEGVSVTVIEGTVVIETDRKKDYAQQVLVEIEPGQAVKFHSDGFVSEIAAVDLKRISAWRDRKIYFNSDRLVDAIEEFNRYTRKKIILKSDALRDKLITGVFNIGDTESFVFALEQAFNISVVRIEESILLNESKQIQKTRKQPSNANTL
jgi:transmembrane sensor